MRSLRVLYASCMLFTLFATPVAAQQVRTAEDTTAHGSDQPSTTLGGYGNAFYSHDAQAGISTVNLERVVLFVGHQFSASASFFSELEMEDAKVSGGENGGEIAFEQAYVRLSTGKNHYVTAGLFLPRMGILNEDHLPTSLYGNERNQVETLILPSTWRELGVGFYGDGSVFSYTIALVNGLNSAAFEHGSVIREGRYEGKNASANNLALTGSLQWRYNQWKAQVAVYYGGSVGLPKQQADSIGLKGGLFGTPVSIGELDAEYAMDGWRLRVLGGAISIPGAEEINHAYANGTPRFAYGAYAEAGYDILHATAGTRSLIAFLRYERLDMNAKIPAGIQTDDALIQNHFTLGLNYYPVPGVVLKGDVRFMHTGDGSRSTFSSLGIGLAF